MLKQRSIFFVLALTLSCERTPETLTPHDYMQWIASRAETFQRVKEVNGLEISVQYLPADFLAYREFLRSDSVSYDSIRKSYACGTTFQISVQAERENHVYGNLLQYKLIDQQEIRDRVKYLSFRIEEFIYVEHQGKQYLPALSHFEGFDGVTNKLSFQVVFLIPEFNCGKPVGNFDVVTVTFDDPYWESGKNNFQLARGVFEDLPTIRM
jgi:hypothetical protein